MPPDPAPEAPEPLGPQRAAFAVPDDVAYFNTASLSPILVRTLEAGQEALRRRAAPWTIATRDWFDRVEELRGLLGALVGGDTEGVAMVPATSYGMEVAARNLAGEVGPTADGGRSILLLAEEYPSGIYTWRRVAADTGADVVTVRPADGEGWTDAVLAALDERVGIVSVPNVHWTDGTLVDLDAVARRCHEVDARLVIDASQSLGVMPLDVAALRPDAVVSVGYKWLLGPYGRAYAWVAERHREGRPVEENWIARAGSDDFAALVEYTDDYEPGARRFDQGGRTLLELTPMAIAALEQLLEWGVPRIAASLAETTATIVDGLAPLGLTPSATGPGRGPHIVGIPVPADARDRALGSLAAAGVHVAARGDNLRVAPHLHVTPADVARLVDALAAAL
jgi:selenocysteine lyase/cysteine desulfurase